ncbi:hypothetical protein SDC9_180222 [bioreactor metagenome]|uniref:Uncharacterized protein n=1 Tax=bioreactor metagenome TaxID=1076179 RepID=A0A645H342_9ZZZZ
MASKEIRIALLKEEIEEFKKSMEYQYGESYMDYSEVTARIKVMEDMIQIISDQE